MNKVLLEIKGKIAIITINRPEKRNALNREVRSELYKIMKDINSKKDIRVAIITGKADSFVAGADIEPMKDYTPEDAEQASIEGSKIFTFIEKMRIPVIAAINGWALGGGLELAMACDLRIASDNAKLGQPEIKLGIIPGYGANIRLPRLIGIGRAKELIFTSRIIDAKEAERIGLINQITSKEELMNVALKLAKKIAEGPIAINFAKKAINSSFELKEDDALRFSSKLYGELYKTHDTKEGIAAYLEKRKPKFKGE
ncbi:MAG: enoyl-CoA hydratase/isomerase family protein [Deltaproteobacteria bacterium]|nr:enoyl-CoA hydratase/isomerase family protein [Deltaproteobacteria bacterium]